MDEHHLKLVILISEEKYTGAVYGHIFAELFFVAAGFQIRCQLIEAMAIANNHQLLIIWTLEVRTNSFGFWACQ